MIRSARTTEGAEASLGGGVPGLRVDLGRVGADRRRRRGDGPLASSCATASSTARYSPGRTSETGSSSILSYDGRRIEGVATEPHVPRGTTPAVQSPACQPLRTSKPSNSPVAAATPPGPVDPGAGRSIAEDRRASRSRTSRGPSATQCDASAGLVGDPARRARAGEPPRRTKTRKPTPCTRPCTTASRRWSARSSGSGSRHAVQPSARASTTSSGLTLPSRRSPASSSRRSCCDAEAARDAGRDRLEIVEEVELHGPRRAARGRRARGPGRRRARSPRARGPPLAARPRARAPPGPVPPARPIDRAVPPPRGRCRRAAHRRRRGARPTPGARAATAPRAAALRGATGCHAAPPAAAAACTAAPSAAARASRSRAIRSRSVRVAVVRSRSVRPTSDRIVERLGRARQRHGVAGPAGGEPGQPRGRRRLGEARRRRGSPRRPRAPPARGGSGRSATGSSAAAAPRPWR